MTITVVVPEREGGSSSDIATAVETCEAAAALVTPIFNYTDELTALNAIVGELVIVSGISDDVVTVAGISSAVTTVAGISGNVTTVAGINANVTTVAGISSSVVSVASNSTDITTVATSIANVNTVAGISGNVTTVAGLSADVTTVAGIASDVTAVAGDLTNINTVATDQANIDTVAGISTDVTAVATIDTEVAALAPLTAEITALGAISSDIAALGPISADVTTCADNLTDIQDAAAIAGPLIDKVGGSLTYTTLTTGDDTIAGSAIPAGYVYVGSAFAREQTLTEVRVKIANAGNGTGSLVIVSKSGTTGTVKYTFPQTGVTATTMVFAAGTHFTADLVMQQGWYLAWQATAAQARPTYAASGANFNSAQASTLAQGATFTLSNATQTYAIGATGRYMPEVVEARLDNIDEDLGYIADTQLIGYPGTIPDGTFTTTSFSTNRYFHAEKASAPGRLSRLLVYTSAAGTVYIQVGRIVAGVLTWVGAEYAVTIAGGGLNTIDLTGYEIELAEGDMIGLRGAILRLTTTSTTRCFGGGYHVVTADSTTLTTGPVINALLHWRFEVIHQRTRMKHQRQMLTIKGSDKIVVVGTSYGADEFTLKSKWWGQKAANLSEWRFENFSYGGSTAQTITDYIQVRSYSTIANNNVSFLDIGAAYALVRNTENDASYSENNTRTLIDTIVSCGITPIIATEHRNTWGTTTLVAHAAMANYADGFLLDGATHPQNVSALIDYVDNGSAYGSYTANFYYGQATSVPHVNVRANDIAAYPVEKFLREQIGRPRKSLRIWRIRPLYDGTAPTVSDIADLKYNTLYDRAVLWKEIDSAHWCLPSTHEKYLDDILNHTPTLAIADFQKIESEYLSLQFGRTIALTDYSLIECIHPALHSDTEAYALQISDPAATVYVWDRLKHPSNATYPSETLPAGNWKQVPVDASGYAYVQGKDIPGTVMRDKVQFLVYKSGGIAAFTAPVLHVWGEARYREQVKYPTTKPTGSELITTASPSTGSAIASGWTATGTPTYGTGIQSTDLPRGSVGHVVVTSANKVSFTTTLTADTSAVREMEVAVWSAVDPALFDSATDTYPKSGCISNNTFDEKRLIVEVGYGSTFVAFKGVAGTWWRPTMFRVPVPRGASNPIIRISASSGSILVALASCKLV